jgi:hypothetical protein
MAVCAARAWLHCMPLAQSCSLQVFLRLFVCLCVHMCVHIQRRLCAVRLVSRMWSCGISSRQIYFLTSSFCSFISMYTWWCLAFVHTGYMSKKANAAYFTCGNPLSSFMMIYAHIHMHEDIHVQTCTHIRIWICAHAYTHVTAQVTLNEDKHLAILPFVDFLNHKNFGQHETGMCICSLHVRMYFLHMRMQMLCILCICPSFFCVHICMHVCKYTQMYTRSILALLV